MLLANAHRVSPLHAPLPCTLLRRSLPVAASSKKFFRRPPPPPIDRISPNKTISVKEQRQLIQEDEEEEEKGEQQRKTLSPSAPRKFQPPPLKSTGKVDLKEETTLSGSDILIAMQKAFAKKKEIAAKKARRKGSPPPPPPPAKRTEVIDDADVRPLEIKEDWGSRIGHLEKLIVELQQRHGLERS